jgi:CubicO group peptidase (beta-lactamase class C family)
MARLLAAAWLLGCCATCCAVSAKPRRNLGPGRGPWEFATPESQGLSTDALRAAEERVNEEMGGDRFCFIVVKNGYMVHETYRRGHQPSSLFGAWSATKSLCASLYGVAVQQGWANATDMVRERNSNTRQCNADTTFQHVLTMTGTSDPADPEWWYDAEGDVCLDTIADFIDQNNPEGLSGSAWKEKYFMEALGMEDSIWFGEDLPGHETPFPCGYGVDASCRDLARAGQLWANNGAWAGVEGQMMDEQYSRDARSWVYPSVDPPYGYLTYVREDDPVDPGVAEFLGAGCQSVFVSHEQQAVVVSMGDFGFLCEPIWANTREAIVSGAAATRS